MILAKKILAIATLTIMLPGVSLAVPVMPHQFYGTVNFSNGIAPNGLSVQAKIDGTLAGSTTTKDGKYGYDPLFKIEDDDGSLSGKVVEFYVSGIKANETAVFANGSSTQRNLTVPGVVPTPTPTPPPSSGGGGANPPSSTPTSTPNPTPVLTSTPTPKIPLTEEAKKVDADNNGIIDVMDFNTLMVNWGNGGGTGDFDGSGSVDVFDFNMLMINWS